jgi:HSP20 family protein
MATMNRYDPFGEMVSLRDAMDRLFQESFIRPQSGGGGGGVPADVSETSDAYELRASLPGWRPEDVTITVQNGTVTISGQHRPEAEGQSNRTYHLRERRFASFSRSFAFPGDVDADRAEASFEHGELRLTLPKSERAKPRQIRIGASTPPANVAVGGESR